MNKIHATLVCLLACTQLALAATAMPGVDKSIGLYQVPVEPGVTYDDLILSLKWFPRARISLIRQTCR